MRCNTPTRSGCLASLLATFPYGPFSLAAAAPVPAEEIIGPRRLEYRGARYGIPAANATVDIATDDFAGDTGYIITRREE